MQNLHKKFLGTEKGTPVWFGSPLGWGVASRSGSFRTAVGGRCRRGLDFIILDVRGLAGVDGGLDFIILNV